MNALSRFEGFMQELMDRRVVQMMGGSLQPVELAHAIARCMETERRTDRAVPITPNRFRILINPVDYADLRELDTQMEHSLETYAVERARERGFNFEGPPEVEMAADIELSRGQFKVHGAVEAARPAFERSGGKHYGYEQPEFLHREDVQWPPDDGVGLEIAASNDDVARLPIDHFPYVIGRLEGNDLVLPDPRVSRRHAVIEVAQNRHRVRDLGSRNGTRINGQEISEAELRDGDRLGIGTFEAVVRVPASEGSRSTGA